MASSIIINSDEKRRNLVAMLNGDVEKVESLLKQNNNKPLLVFDVPGVVIITILIVTSSLLCFTMLCFTTTTKQILVEEIFQKC